MEVKFTQKSSQAIHGVVSYKNWWGKKKEYGVYLPIDEKINTYYENWCRHSNTGKLVFNDAIRQRLILDYENKRTTV